VKKTNKGRYQSSVLIQARKPTGSRLPFKGNSPPLRVWHARRNSHAAGFLLGGPSIDPDDDQLFEECQSVEIEFEDQEGSFFNYAIIISSMTQSLTLSVEYQHFTDIWEQAIQFRREKKVVLRKMGEQMSYEQYNGEVARRLKF